MPDELIDPSWSGDHPSARLVAHWLPLADRRAVPTDLADGSIGGPARARTEVTVQLDLSAPTAPGAYLLSWTSPAHSMGRSPRPGSHRAGPGHRRCGRPGRRAGGYSRGALINRPRREIAPVASAATPIAMSLRSAGGSGRTADRN